MGGLGNGLLVATVLVTACASKPRPAPTQPAPAASPVISDDHTATGPDIPTAPARDPAWSAAPTTASAATAPADDRPVVVSDDELGLCDEADKHLKSFDLSGDGKADVWKLYRAATDAGAPILTCKKLDLDFDGKVDMTAGYIADGALLFEQFDLTFNGRIDMLKRYDPTTKVAIETAHDSDSDGVFDVFESYDSNGELILVARDRNGDKALDVWEIHEAGELVERQFDDNYDGVVDRSE